MTRRWWLPAIAIALGVAVVGTVAHNWDPPLPPAAADSLAPAVPAEVLQRAGERRVFFGHMSVGWNLLSGVAAIYSADSIRQPAEVQIKVGESFLGFPAGQGGIVHAEIGVNGDPLGKLVNFDAMVRSGIAAQVDVAVLKFCYTEFGADTDVEAVFAKYAATMQELRRDFPRVHFLYATVPLEVPPSGVKGLLKSWLGRDANVQRERFNALVRQHFGGPALFDVAAVEATAPDGSASAGLYPPYSSDGSHLNGTGAKVLAAHFLQLVASVGS